MQTDICNLNKQLENISKTFVQIKKHNRKRDRKMNTRENMVIIKGEIKTSDVRTCQYNSVSKKMDVEFNNGKKYSYAYSNVECLKEPQNLKPDMYRISRSGRDFFDIKEIYVFKGIHDTYWHICFADGSERDYCQSELKVVKSCLCQVQAKNVLEYVKQIANLSDLKNEETGEKMLAKKFEKNIFCK